MLRNRYVLVRHGRSEANEAGIIASDPVDGEETHDLTPLGRQQASETAKALAAKYPSQPDRIQIHASPFLRTRSTALVLHDEGFPSSPDPIADDRLCERFFGMFDGKEDKHYRSLSRPPAWIPRIVEC